MQQLIPPTIEYRALEYVQKGIDPVEAVKQAITDENNLIWLCLGVDMERGYNSQDIAEEIKGHLSVKVYDRIRSTKK